VTFIDVLWLLGIIPVAFVQNMVFTAVSRSRNSGDPSYHRKWAYLSNFIWLICQFFIWKHFWAAFNSNAYWAMAIMAIFYTVSTAEGSVLMMRKMLAMETGKQKVGANEAMEAQIKDMAVTLVILRHELEHVYKDLEEHRAAIHNQETAIERIAGMAHKTKVRVETAGI
jgi:hypothetical protein